MCRGQGGTPEGPGDGITKAYLAQMLEQNANDVAAKSADAIHKEDVKLYKNVQAIVEENANRITKAVTVGGSKTAEEVAAESWVLCHSWRR